MCVCVCVSLSLSLSLSLFIYISLVTWQSCTTVLSACMAIDSVGWVGSSAFVAIVGAVVRQEEVEHSPASSDAEASDEAVGGFVGLLLEHVVLVLQMELSACITAHGAPGSDLRASWGRDQTNEHFAAWFRCSTLQKKRVDQRKSGQDNVKEREKLCACMWACMHLVEWYEDGRNKEVINRDTLMS